MFNLPDLNHVFAWCMEGIGTIARPVFGVVKMDHDRRLFIRAEMMTLLEGIPAGLVDRHPLQFMLHLDQVRQRAAQHHLFAVHDLACACEAEMQKNISCGGGKIVAIMYLDAMRAALDCEELSPQMSESLMASVALRLGGQP